MKMFTMKCPKCEARISLIVHSFQEVRQKTRECPFCEVHFKLSNQVLIGILSGLLIAGGLTVGGFCNIPFLFRAIIIFFVMLMPLFITKLFGRWKISE